MRAFRVTREPETGFNTGHVMLLLYVPYYTVLEPDGPDSDVRALQAW
jgi:hypothetical protein